VSSEKMFNLILKLGLFLFSKLVKAHHVFRPINNMTGWSIFNGQNAPKGGYTAWLDAPCAEKS
jgi:hypothetical protein